MLVLVKLRSIAMLSPSASVTFSYGKSSGRNHEDPGKGSQRRSLN
jgi:hypothetical protein